MAPAQKTLATRTTATRASGHGSRRGRGRVPVVAVPLGSLTQRVHRPDSGCRGCGSVHVTRLSMSLTDGTPVDFTSCHRCEHRTWEHADGELSVEGVLQRSRKE